MPTSYTTRTPFKERPRRQENGLLAGQKSYYESIAGLHALLDVG